MEYLPEISVVIPVFNGSMSLGETLNAIRTQTFANLEVICANDCSTDDGLDILSAKAYPLGSGPTMGSDKGGRFG